MNRPLLVLIAALWIAPAFARTPHPPARSKAAAPAKSVVPDSQQMEKDLQQLSWPQFRSVIESVPKMRADVEAYGAFGWKYVEARYASYPWKKNIDKLDEAQKQHLADLIRKAKAGK
jgi:hypothetical protein